eukprot:TRINITY_DN6325_c0_g1_i1.p1 TRINITY_DN6325_c0_g1~~TRINITY_DN6325_c0_g1_i1.p1  ORF type:complete len:301 (+),score=50.66 TRINITY_DN6325_c0_g1_i1:35-937(+)
MSRQIFHQIQQNKKHIYVSKLLKYLLQYHHVVLVDCFHVPGKLIDQMRREVRRVHRDNVFVMGKKVDMIEAIQLAGEERPALLDLVPFVRGNMGLLFTDGSSDYLVSVVIGISMMTRAKEGQKATVDVVIPKGPTQLSPVQTQYISLMNIPTKISRGCIEILNDTLVLEAGDTILYYHAEFLKRMGILPIPKRFKIVVGIEDDFLRGSDTYITDKSAILNTIRKSVFQLESIGKAIKYPTQANVIRDLISGYADLIAVSKATGYSFSHYDMLKSKIEKSLSKLKRSEVQPIFSFWDFNDQ